MTIPVPSPSPMVLDQALRRELVAGERFLWSKQPLARRLKGGFAIWIFAIPWTVFALFWESAAFLPWFASSKTPDVVRLTFGIVMPLFGLPFILIGLWMLWRPLKAVRQAKNTIYCLTTRRVIRIVDGKPRTVASVLLDQIGPIDRSEAADGTGHLYIQTHSHVDSEGDRTTERFEVLGVPDVARLERLLLETRG